MMATPFIWQDNHILLYNPLRCQEFRRALCDLPIFGFKVKRIQYNNSIELENEMGMFEVMFKVMFDKCPSLALLNIVTRAPKSILRVLDSYEDFNPLPDLQEFILIHSFLMLVLHFDSLYASIQFTHMLRFVSYRKK
jgi:hypothetical protein